MQRVLLLVPSTSYRAPDFLAAAGQIGVEVTIGSNSRQVLQEYSDGRSLAIDFEPVGEGVSQILAHARRYPFSAILATDDETAVLAATAAKLLGVPGNDPESVAPTRDKHRFRQALAGSGVRSPWFELVDLRGDLTKIAKRVTYPCVLKPLNLSASQGVIRVDGESEFPAAAERIACILRDERMPTDTRYARSVLTEAFIPGREVALDGLLTAGGLKPLALFDKPDPLDGPFFQETLYITPSRLPDVLQREIVAETARAAFALGLRHGPIHAELRINDEGVWIVELAARSIGGLCSRALEFVPGMKLEELILRHALGLPTDNFAREDDAAGVMMIPIPGVGTLRAVHGLGAARSVSGIVDVRMAISTGELLKPVPEGGRYLGFIFAKAGEPHAVEGALREAHRRLRFDIEPSSTQSASFNAMATPSALRIVKTASVA
jgi:formate-dependent phosphoribosylglycinamide formyltransferase (GAR transformylase)